jgi:hypothetical protein
MKLLRALLLGAVCLAFFASAARADIIFEDKNDPQPDEQNILFKTNQFGSDITGFTNMSNVGVLFHSDINTLQTKGLGQAQIINYYGGNLNQIMVSVPGYQFHDFIVDLNDAPDSVINITVFASDGTFTHQFTGKTGENFETIIAKNGEEINSILFESDGGWATFKQPRISGLEAVPEPGTLVMLGSGVVGLAGVLRRKLR